MQRKIKSAEVTIVVALVVSATLQLWIPSAGMAQQSNCQTFKETGKTACGKCLQYWQKNGGLAQQGFPISNEFQEKSDLNGQTYTVQYFERAVFEVHPEDKPPHDVLLSQLGTFRFNEKYPDKANKASNVSLSSVSGDLAYPGPGVPRKIP